MFKKTIKTILFGFVSILVILGLGACGTVQDLFNKAPDPTPVATVTSSGKVTAEGRIVPKQDVTLAFPVGGEVTSLPFAEGQLVSKDAVLASLGEREQLDAALTSALLEKLDAQQALDKLNRNAGILSGQAEQTLADAVLAYSEAQKAFNDVDTEDYRTQLDDAATKVQDAKDKLKDAQDKLDKYANLEIDNQTRKDAQKAKDDAQKTYDNAAHDWDVLQNKKDVAQAALDLAKAKLTDAQRNVDQRKNGPDPDDLALSQARLDNAAALVTAGQRALDNLDLKAPFAGTVVNLDPLKIGQWIGAGQPAVTLADYSEWFVETKDLTEMDVVKVSVGQKVVMTPDALPDLKLNGVVEQINQDFTEKSGDVLYMVRIHLDQVDLKLMWGMTVKVTFE